MEKLKEIIEEGQKLVEKKTWLRKGYTELIEKINKELAKIPDMEESPLSYLLREYTQPGHYESFKRIMRCNLVFSGKAYLELELSKETVYEWKKEIISMPAVETIRMFVKKLPEMFDYYLEEIKKINKENQQAIDIITNLLEKFQ